MKLIAAGVVLDIIAVGLIIVLIFLPMFVSDNASLNNFYASFLCDSGERYVPTTTVTEDYDGTGYSLYAACLGERGEVDVTPKQTVIGVVAFAIPLLLAIGLQFLGAMQIKARNSRPREVTSLVNALSGHTPIGGLQSVSAPSAKTLSEKLAEADEAYESRRISREEYDSLRKKIIDESSS